MTVNRSKLLWGLSEALDRFIVTGGEEALQTERCVCVRATISRPESQKLYTLTVEVLDVDPAERAL